jgi:hypothetical protein
MQAFLGAERRPVGWTAIYNLPAAIVTMVEAIRSLEAVRSSDLRSGRTPRSHRPHAPKSSAATARCQRRADVL